MGKGALVTRSELRRRKEEQEAALERNRQLVKQQTANKNEKKINNRYRRELASKPVTKSRANENQRSREMNAFLLKSIVLVTILLIVVGLMVFFL